MGNLSHEKGEISGLGRLVEVMSFNNRNYKLDPSWHNGIISVRNDADGVNSNDDDIATKIIKKIHIYISAYLGNEHTIKLASLLTDHGGGGGTMESCADEIKKKENTLLDNFLFIKNCMLHGHSKPLELSWLDLFGKFGTGELIVSKLVYDLWYIQDCLKEFFHVTWPLLVGDEWQSPLLCKCILYQWEYPL